MRTVFCRLIAVATISFQQGKPCSYYVKATTMGSYSSKPGVFIWIHELLLKSSLFNHPSILVSICLLSKILLPGFFSQYLLQTCLINTRTSCSSYQRAVLMTIILINKLVSIWFYLGYLEIMSYSLEFLWLEFLWI